MLPEKVLAKRLEQKHTDYDYYKEAWETIAQLREGSPAILQNATKYCPRRPGEAEDIYQIRLSKLSYTPLMSYHIFQYVSKLISAPVYLSGVENESYWAKWRSSVDAKGLDELGFLSNIFSCLLYFGRCYIALDLPSQVKKYRSHWEAQDDQTMPYVLLYEPLDVLNWSDDSWYITRQVETTGDALDEPKIVCRWLVRTKEEVSRYSAEVKVNSAGRPVEILSDTKWLPIDHPNAVVYQDSQWLHGLGRCPILCLELPSEAWIGKAVYRKQVQHLQIESAWTDTGTMAGIIQRLYTPTPPVAQTDPRVVYQPQPDYNQLSKADNAHILIGSNFEFKESSGSAIGNLSSQLQIIEGQLKYLASMSFASVTKGAVMQSGTSKGFDMAMMADAMKAYGAKVRQFYEDILQLVAKLSNSSEDIRVHGLSTYSVDNLETMLTQAEKLESLPLLPPTVKRIWYGKLVNLLVGTVSPDVSVKIEEELDSILKEEFNK
ncbi:hypothetical protein [Floridanema aerugineum]|uniref:Portal protein n=1 Tax=Floridaenema aerugineum BLCC-F46 TaxID=3153654 RepID=A0ABV4X270_9CYAN